MGEYWGQLIPQQEIDKLIKNIQGNKIKSWNEVHEFYKEQGENYKEQKLYHALAALKETHGIQLKKISASVFGICCKKIFSPGNGGESNIRGESQGLQKSFPENGL
jgi:hypothetical protein